MSYALVLYRDHADSDKSFVTHCYPFSEHLQNLQYALDSARAGGGGGDGAEAVADGLYEACYNMSWRENSHKVIILAGDAPPHGRGGYKDKYPEGCPCGHDPITIAGYAHARGISVFSLGIGNNKRMKESFEQIA